MVMTFINVRVNTRLPSEWEALPSKPQLLRNSIAVTVGPVPAPPVRSSSR